MAGAEVTVDSCDPCRLVRQAFDELYPSRPFKYRSLVTYTRRLSPFNANIRLVGNIITISLSEQWRDIDLHIQQGLIESLIGKMFKNKRRTSNISLYKNFLKTIDTITEKTNSDPVLESSFNRLNEDFFNNMLEKPNLRWGQLATRRLGSYHFQSDRITISSIFKQAEQHQLDFIMYHEMLHKHHKFTSQGTNDSYHSREFRADEKKFPDAEKIEKEISKLAGNVRRML